MRVAGPLALLAGLAVVLLGLEPRAAALAVVGRVAPVLAFLLVVKVLADLVDDAGLFDVVADRAARAARGRTGVLYAVFVGVCVVATWLLSLDTTAVLLTPVALALAARLRIDPRPFALATLWLANTASLLLPVANLTNLLALHRLGLPTSGYVRLLASPQAVVLGVTVGVLVLRQRTRLRGTYAVDGAPMPVLSTARWAAAAAVGLGAAVVLGAPPWCAASAALVVLLVAVGRVDRRLTAPARLLRLAPWSMAAFALGLFLVIDAATPHLPLGRLVPTGDDAAARVGTALLGAAAANGVDNLPAYLALEPHVHGGHAVAALLVGVNAGPLVSPWGSLATLLWLQVCRDRGLAASRASLALEGLLLVPLVVVAGALAA